jgi:hypothetical protein
MNHIPIKSGENFALLASNRCRKELRSRRLVCFWLNNLTRSIKRPECVFEQVLRIVEPFDLAETGPVLAKTGFGTLGWLMAAEELEDLERASSRVGIVQKVGR